MRIDNQLGLEPTPEAYVENMVRVFREVRRVLRDDGTVFLNLGDSFYGGKGASNYNFQNERVSENLHGKAHNIEAHIGGMRPLDAPQNGLKPKDLVGIPWRVAFALQADGWWLRSDIIWAKPNPMPESVRDRPTKSHEFIFLLTKSARYFYDAEAVAEEALRPEGSGNAERKLADGTDSRLNTHLGRSIPWKEATRNRRSVWTIATKPFSEAHFAVFPPELPEICIKAGCPEGGTVLDPFAGAGTTLMVALRLCRSAIGIELNPEYAEMARNRIDSDCPLFNRKIENVSAAD